MAGASVGRRARMVEAKDGRTVRRGPLALWACMFLVGVVAEGFIVAKGSRPISDAVAVSASGPG